MHVEEEQAILTLAREGGRVHSRLTGEYGIEEYSSSAIGTFGDTA